MPGNEEEPLRAEEAENFRIRDFEEEADEQAGVARCFHLEPCY